MIGKILYGYCRGYFGRDFWGPATIVGEGKKRIVVEDENDDTFYTSFVSYEDKIKFIEENSKQ